MSTDHLFVQTREEKTDMNLKSDKCDFSSDKKSRGNKETGRKQSHASLLIHTL